MPSARSGSRPLVLLGAPLLLAALLWPQDAAANGQSTHLWITADALTHVPEGPLLDFLSRPELRKMLDNGTMFPDGGYPLDDPYAEIAHWEPFQATYLDWIAQTYAYPITASPEGAEHLAFLMGLGSHGMADQVFDSLYGERVKHYDGAFGDFDTASDLIMMSNFPPMMAPSDWVPYEVFDQVYDQVGYDVDPAKMMQGQNLLRIAVNSVAIFSQMEAEVAEAALPFPWGSQHLLDEEVEGSPPCEGEVIARYWRVLWALAHGQPLPGPVMASLPADGGANHPTDSSTLESWVSVMFARGLETAALTADDFQIQAEGGELVPLDIWHYYGQDAHVVHLRPQQDLAPDTLYTVVVEPGILTIHGEPLDGYQFRFSTGASGPDPIVPAWPADHDPSPDPGDGDGDGGEGSGETGGTGADTETGGEDPTGVGDPETGPGEGSTGGPGLDEDGGADGCSCSSGAGERRGLTSLLWLGLLAGLRRPRSPRAAARARAPGSRGSRRSRASAR